MKLTISTARGWRYQGPHVFNSPEKAIGYLREKFDDREIDFDTDPHEEGAATVDIITKLCGNTKVVATAMID